MIFEGTKKSIFFFGLELTRAGKSIPDISVMPELCEIFDITVNELLSGERIDKEDYVMKAENNFYKCSIITKESRD